MVSGSVQQGLWSSDDPARYPLNTNSALCVNTVFAYPFYIAPVLFPKAKWHGNADLPDSVQAQGHGGGGFVQVVPADAGNFGVHGHVTAAFSGMPSALLRDLSTRPVRHYAGGRLPLRPRLNS
jgi:hypothetical protein